MNTPMKAEYWRIYGLRIRAELQDCNDRNISIATHSLVPVVSHLTFNCIKRTFHGIRLNNEVVRG